MKRVGILGASGFTGAELLRLAALHPEIEVVLATGDSLAGQLASSVYPSLAAGYPNLVFGEYDPTALDDLDLLFTCLPHGASGHLMPELVKRVPHIVDLAADFRLKDPSLYPTWYGEEHPHPELLGEFAFGLPELTRAEILERDHVAAAGCYVTAASLALAPLVAAGLIDPAGVIVDAASGVSGAGRVPKPSNSFCTVDEDFTAYGLINHRHTPEMEQATGAQILFTPHLAPMNRGILATCYARPVAAGSSLSTESLLAALARAYDREPFVVVRPASPSTKATYGTNAAHLTARFDPRTGYVVTICAIDNLCKGASGQALQCANILLGLEETLGLPVVGVFP
jgi:N-acetyl-gamma-glutamyl-phosphate reductase